MLDVAARVAALGVMLGTDFSGSGRPRDPDVCAAITRSGSCVTATCAGAGALTVGADVIAGDAAATTDPDAGKRTGAAADEWTVACTGLSVPIGAGGIRSATS
jgi:hypothetical protein